MLRQLAALLLLGLFVFVSNAAKADGQWNARLGIGFGGSLGGAEPDFLYTNSLRAEVLFGAPGDEHIRLGPALELRTADFCSIEGAGGATLLLPLFRGFPLTVSALVGYAARRDRESGAFVAGILTWGYRSYDFHDPYQMGFQIFVSARTDLHENPVTEITAGIELDLEALFVLPARLIISFFRGGSPDEPESVEE